MADWYRLGAYGAKFTVVEISLARAREQRHAKVYFSPTFAAPRHAQGYSSFPPIDTLGSSTICLRHPLDHFSDFRYPRLLG
jgi:hypothetical protein